MVRFAYSLRLPAAAQLAAVMYSHISNVFNVILNGDSLNESPLDGYLIQCKIFNRFPLFQDYMSIDGAFSI
jgi:hypothetical protein